MLYFIQCKSIANWLNLHFFYNILVKYTTVVFGIFPCGFWMFNLQVMLQPCTSCRHWRAKLEGLSEWSSKQLGTCCNCTTLDDTVVEAILKNNFCQSEPSCQDVLNRSTSGKVESISPISWDTIVEALNECAWLSGINKSTECSIVLLLYPYVLRLCIIQLGKAWVIPT